MKCRGNEIVHEIFRVVSRFPRYISYYIPENRLPLGQCTPRLVFLLFQAPWRQAFSIQASTHSIGLSALQPVTSSMGLHTENKRDLSDLYRCTVKNMINSADYTVYNFFLSVLCKNCHLGVQINCYY